MFFFFVISNKAVLNLCEIGLTMYSASHNTPITSDSKMQTVVIVGRFNKVNELQFVAKKTE